MRNLHRGLWLLVGGAMVLLNPAILTFAQESSMNTPSAATPDTGWELVWADEFDVDGAPDRTRWSYEEGFIRNEEAQYYTRDRRENARVENGCLVIEARRERWGNPRYQSDSEHWKQKRQFAEYTSASLNTADTFTFQYGRIEMRARLPQGRGVWPAIWTLGDNIRQIGWPRCGEIDIMEFVGHTPDHVYANIHYHGEGRHQAREGRLKVQAPYDDFHLYAIEWCEQRIDFFFDDRKYHSVDLDVAGQGADNAFRKPHYLLLNLAIGGTWGGEVDQTIFPQQYLIDYVRIFQRRE